MKRYDCETAEGGVCVMQESPDGDWVRLEDVAELQAPMRYICTDHEYQGLEPCPACAASLEGLAAGLRRAVAVIDALPRCRCGAIATATDDYLAGGVAYLCDEHSRGALDVLPYASALRAYEAGRK